MIVIHLVIVGQNPNNNEYSIGLAGSETGLGLSTTKINLKKEPDIDACSLATKYIKAPLEWYSVRKQTFIYSDNVLRLIYIATVPNNISLIGINWYPITSLNNVKFENEIEKDIIIEGIKN